jgi:hypothetical protein
VKSWWKSKTLWLNGIAVVLAAAEAQFSFLKPVLGESIYGVAFFALTVGNVALRFYTTQAVGKVG